MLDEVRNYAAICTRCTLHKGRINPVFDKGNSEAKFMICGMVPAHDENMAGLPFVGRAGQLLDTILNDVGLDYRDIYITNLVKCFLAAGKTLSEEWVAACRPILNNQIDIIKPLVIVALGADASQSLTDVDLPIGKLRHRIFFYSENTIIVPTYHPSYLLRGGGTTHKAYPKVIADFNLALNCYKELSNRK
jgi:DNA polymerase